MPLYEYECRKCGMKHDAFRGVEDRDKAPSCDCGAECDRIISKPNFNPDIYAGYFDPNLAPKHSQDNGRGTYVESRQHHRELCKQYGVTPIG